MKQIATLFSRMDAWRHLPSYQLERRADLFFSLYLREVLETKLGFQVAERFIPEFPVRVATVRRDSKTNRSYKIDYVAMSADARKAILVELKTDGLSRRNNQDKDLVAARDAGLPALLDGVLDIFRVTKFRRKYFALLKRLECMGLLRIPAEVEEIMSRPRLHGLTKASDSIGVTTSATETIIVHVQPNGTGDEIINFEDFRAVVQAHDDPISQRFAQSLKEWAAIKAGEAGTSIKSKDVKG